MKKYSMQTATVSSAEVAILVSDKSTLNFTLPPKKLPEIKDILQWLKTYILAMTKKNTQCIIPTTKHTKKFMNINSVICLL